MTTSSSGARRFFDVSAVQDEIDAAARRMYDAECALHIARQSGVDAWVVTAYEHLHSAIAEHTRWQNLLDRRLRSVATSEQAVVSALADEFPALPMRIIAAVAAAFEPTYDTPVQLLNATRQRLVDALTA